LSGRGECQGNNVRGDMSRRNAVVDIAEAICGSRLQRALHGGHRRHGSISSLSFLTSQPLYSIVISHWHGRRGIVFAMLFVCNVLMLFLFLTMFVCVSNIPSKQLSYGHETFRIYR